jgi:hypothetical protein
MFRFSDRRTPSPSAWLATLQNRCVPKIVLIATKGLRDHSSIETEQPPTVAFRLLF